MNKLLMNINTSRYRFFEQFISNKLKMLSFTIPMQRLLLTLNFIFAVVSAGCSGSSSILNYVTLNRVYRNFIVEDSITCALECYHDTNCSSYNYEYQPIHPSEHICQLSRCGDNGTLVENRRFWFHQLRPSKVKS